MPTTNSTSHVQSLVIPKTDAKSTHLFLQIPPYRPLFLSLSAEPRLKTIVIGRQDIFFMKIDLVFDILPCNGKKSESFFYIPRNCNVFKDFFQAHLFKMTFYQKIENQKLKLRLLFIFIFFSNNQFKQRVKIRSLMEINFF